MNIIELPSQKHVLSGSKLVQDPERISNPFTELEYIL